MTKRDQPSVKINGNIEGNNINLGEQTFHSSVTFTYTPPPSASDDIAKQLQDLYQKLASALAQLPAEQAQSAKVVQIAAEDALKEAEAEAPDKARLEIRGENLVKAAQNLLNVAPIAVEIAQKLLMLG